MRGEGIPSGLFATPISTAEMLPCVGQAALGFEIRESDPRIEKICKKLKKTFHKFLRMKEIFQRPWGNLRSHLRIGQTYLLFIIRWRVKSFRWLAKLVAAVILSVRAAETPGRRNIFRTKFFLRGAILEELFYVVRR